MIAQPCLCLSSAISRLDGGGIRQYPIDEPIGELVTLRQLRELHQGEVGGVGGGVSRLPSPYHHSL